MKLDIRRLKISLHTMSQKPQSSEPRKERSRNIFKMIGCEVKSPLRKIQAGNDRQDTNDADLRLDYFEERHFEERKEQRR